MLNRLNWPARIAIAAVLLALVIAGQHTFVSKLALATSGACIFYGAILQHRKAAD